MTRCFDCLEDLPDDTPRFVVLKRMREMPADADEVEKRLFNALCFDPVPICADCAGWYGDHAIPLERLADHD